MNANDFLNKYGTRFIHTALGCIVWIGAKTEAGYGLITSKRKNYYIHRLMWEFNNGPIRNGLVIDHLCRNRACGNPYHMRLCTRGENVLAGISGSAINARKTHCIRGHPFDDDNTLLLTRRNGERVCKTCVTIRSRGKQWLATKNV